MALQWNLDSLDDLPPEVAALYVPSERDGGYRLDVIEPEQIRSALVVERAARKEAERIAKTAEGGAEAIEKMRREHARLQSANERLRAGTLKMAIVDAATKAGVHAAALADAHRAAIEYYAIDDAGEVKPKSGATPLVDWIRAQQHTSPHWFAATATGSGANGGSTRGHHGAARSMTRARFEALSPAQRTEVVRSGVTITD